MLVDSEVKVATVIEVTVALKIADLDVVVVVVNVVGVVVGVVVSPLLLPLPLPFNLHSIFLLHHHSTGLSFKLLSRENMTEVIIR